VAIAIPATETVTQGSVMPPPLQARRCTALRGRRRQPRNHSIPTTAEQPARTPPQGSRLLISRLLIGKLRRPITLVLRSRGREPLYHLAHRATLPTGLHPLARLQWDHEKGFPEDL